jgi:glycosyltransferase involved in cell wall biosynthesis
MVKAAKELPDVTFHVTGNTSYADKKIIASAPPNVIFTGFLNEPYPYFGYLQSCDAIMVLCTVERTLCAGMYEAAALGKPLIASDLEAVRDFFTSGVVYVKNGYKDIARGVRESRSSNAALSEAMRGFAAEQRVKWPEKLKEVLNDSPG